MRRNLVNLLVSGIASVSISSADTGGPVATVDASAAERIAAQLETPVVRGLLPRLAGDANCDGRVDNFDIDAFILAVSSPEVWGARYAICSFNLDIDGDGALTNFDIEAFVQMMSHEPTGRPTRVPLPVPAVDIPSFGGTSDSSKPLDATSTEPLKAESGVAVPQPIDATSAEPIGPSKVRHLLGDLNCDGRVDNFDIDSYLLLVVDAEMWSKLHPTCSVLNGDFDGDGRLTNFDIDAFGRVMAAQPL